MEMEADRMQNGLKIGEDDWQAGTPGGARSARRPPTAIPDSPRRSAVQFYNPPIAARHRLACRGRGADPRGRQAWYDLHYAPNARC